MEKEYYFVSIRVVKSLVEKEYFFDTVEVLKEPMIQATDKAEVKEIIKSMYPQFFQNGKVYEKETKDQAQFFYLVIRKLSNWQLDQINAGSWNCSHCGEVHENKYISRPRYTNKPPFEGLLFCDNNDHCITEYKKEYYKDVEMPDDEYHVNSESPQYIYKCTEKSTGKCYVGKTRNAPFFRWWNHLTKSSSPFGLYLSSTKLSEWTFEVLEELPCTTPDSEVLKIESEYIVKFDSLNNGFNSVISNKSVINKDAPENQTNLFNL